MGHGKGIADNIISKAVDFDIDLNGRDTVASTANLEVHITEKVFNTLNIHKDFVLTRITISGDQAGRNTGNRFLNGNAGCHKGESAAADGTL